MILSQNAQMCKHSVRDPFNMSEKSKTTEMSKKRDECRTYEVLQLAMVIDREFQ